MSRVDFYSSNKNENNLSEIFPNINIWVFSKNDFIKYLKKLLVRKESKKEVETRI